MLVVGGRTNQVGELLPFEIYDTDTSDWFRFNPVMRFRHAIWLIDSLLYIHGGFDPETPNIPTDKLLLLDLESLFKNNQNLIKTSSFAPRDVFNPQGKHFYIPPIILFPIRCSSSKASQPTASISLQTP